jgi:hypothetical protein
MEVRQAGHIGFLLERGRRRCTPDSRSVLLKFDNASACVLQPATPPDGPKPLIG